MFQSTVTENFESWDKFLDAYYEPIRTALKLIPYVGESRADDLAQSFFLKMYERDILEKRPAITGKFRNWLYVVARRHAVDEWRKSQRRAERLTRPWRSRARRVRVSRARRRTVRCRRILRTQHPSHDGRAGYASTWSRKGSPSTG